MTQAQFLSDVVKWLVNITFWTSLAFPVVTRPFWPWTRSQWGRNIVALELAIAFTLIGSIMNIDLGWRRYPLVFAWITTVSLACVPVIVIWRAVMIWRTQRDGALHDRRLPEAGLAVTWTLDETSLLTLVSSVALIGALAGLVLGCAWGCLVARPRPARWPRFSRRRSRRGVWS